MDLSGNLPFCSAEVIQESQAAPAAPLPWTPLRRLCFRIAFLYFFCFLFLYGNGSLFGLIPVAGNWINRGLAWPMNRLAVWTGHHIFHLTGIAASWHPTGSGDTALNWILNGLFLVFAVGGGLLWTAVAALRGNRRTEYGTLYSWLRFLLRLTIAMFMLGYGLAKVFPLQMAPISIAILNEPVGNMSPMTMLWALIGFNPLYESICGVAEALGGALLLFRRTALLGALLSCFVLANIVLYNFFFDVPVKLFAVNLLLASVLVALGDLRPLFDFFWRHRPAVPAAVWIPPASRRSSRIAIRAVEIAYTLGLLVAMPILVAISWHHNSVATHTPSPLIGAWHLDPDHPASGAFLTPEGTSATNLYIDTAVRAFIRSTDGELWRTGLRLDPRAHTVRINCYTSKPVTYSFQIPDPNHLILTSIPPEKARPGPKGKAAANPVPPFTPAVIALTRIPVPSHYPLFERGFHFVNQWGLER